jgi:hypothetical protein
MEMEQTVYSHKGRITNLIFSNKMGKLNYRIQIIYRRVDNGQIVSEDFARKHPRLTEREVRKIPIK